MKPIIFEVRNVTYLLEDYKALSYKAQIGPVEVSFDFDDEEFFVEIILWGRYRDFLCSNGGNCKYSNTRKCNMSKCHRFKYFTAITSQLKITEKYKTIADYFDLPDIEVNPASRLSALKFYITSLLYNSDGFLDNLYKIPDQNYKPLTIPYKEKMAFLKRPWKIDDVTV